MENKGQTQTNLSLKKRGDMNFYEQIVLEKHIFSNIFDKDIKRVYIYKKSERISKALHLVCPAFKDCRPLRERIERISVDLIDASILPPSEAKERLGRNLLALSSVLEMGKSGGFLSSMNADIIMREAHNLLQEVAAYEEPRLSLPETPSIARIAKDAPATSEREGVSQRVHTTSRTEHSIENTNKGQDKGRGIEHATKGDRRGTIVSILKSKGPSYIKDISVLIREVSEKTIQRELQQLVLDGLVRRSGERRWTTYTLAESDADVT